MARPKIEINRDMVYKLALIQCTLIEISQIIGVSTDTLNRRKWFSNLYKKGLEEGRSSLRRLQWKVANGDYLAKRVTRTNKAGEDVTEETFAAPNPTMLIWLGKQYLGQADQQEIKGNVSINDKDKRELTDEELQAIALSGGKRLWSNSARSGRGIASSPAGQAEAATVL